MSNEHDKLSRAWREMMSLSDDERRQMGANGRRLVEKKYTCEAIVKEMVKGYELMTWSKERVESKKRL